MRYIELDRRRSAWLSSLEPNLIIGGVGGTTINNKADLATRLDNGYSVNNILKFEIVGSEVRAYVNKDYFLSNNTGTLNFSSNTNITSFKDLGGRCKSIRKSAYFQFCTNLSEISFPAVTNVDSAYAFRGCTSLTGSFTFPAVTTLGGVGVFMDCTNITEVHAPELLNITNGHPDASSYKNSGISKLNYPKCATLGTTTGDNNVFKDIKIGCEIIVPTSLQTANAGAEEGDVAYARNTRLATITYV